MCCKVAQQLIARTTAGRTPKVKLDDGSKVAMCAGCGERLDSRGKKLLACARCKAAVYCGKDCQKQAWPTHKKYCRAPSEPLLSFKPGAGTHAVCVRAHARSTRELGEDSSTRRHRLGVDGRAKSGD